ncbi:Eukaryotic initiation factor 4A-III [Thoreauomyces humboldtii]|nr:Eukaryotic initiation factor 4A-III [Thoreauomyces humboldtii]
MSDVAGSTPPPHPPLVSGLHWYIPLADPDWKLDTLCDLAKIITVTQTVAFVRNGDRCAILAAQMHNRQFTASGLHMKMGLGIFSQTLEDFDMGKVRLLIADAAILSEDGVRDSLLQVDLIINVDFPMNPADYVQRSSKSGRRPRTINFVVEGQEGDAAMAGREMGVLREIEGLCGVTMEDWGL